MYRIFYRGGTYRDVKNPGPFHTFKGTMRHLADDPVRQPIWAVVNLDICDGGGAYQALMATLAPVELPAP
jgi:hypothetical protein